VTFFGVVGVTLVCVYTYNKPNKLAYRHRLVPLFRSKPNIFLLPPLSVCSAVSDFPLLFSSKEPSRPPFIGWAIRKDLFADVSTPKQIATLKNWKQLSRLVSSYLNPRVSKSFAHNKRIFLMIFQNKRADLTEKGVTEWHAQTSSLKRDFVDDDEHTCSHFSRLSDCNEGEK